MDSSTIGMANIEDLDPKRTAIVVGPFLGLLASPVVFQTMKIVECDHSFNATLIAFMVTTLLCITFMVLINNYLRYNCHLTKRNQQMKAYQQRSFIQKLLSVFSSDSSQNYLASSDQANSSFSFLHTDNSLSDDYNQHKRKIDPKYFKPKFIINELMTFWGTTCTVVTWGSFYVIGGTIVATERIAQRIKPKRSTTRDSREHSFKSSFGGARGTGQNDSFLNMSFGSSTGASEDNASTNRRHTFRRISSWTKRSYTSMKKKFSRVATTSTPHFSSLTSPLNMSSSRS